VLDELLEDRPLEPGALDDVEDPDEGDPPDPEDPDELDELPDDEPELAEGEAELEPEDPPRLVPLDEPLDDDDPVPGKLGGASAPDPASPSGPPLELLQPTAMPMATASETESAC